jgi:hypothetical protein
VALCLMPQRGRQFRGRAQCDRTTRARPSHSDALDVRERPGRRDREARLSRGRANQTRSRSQTGSRWTWSRVASNGCAMSASSRGKDEIARRRVPRAHVRVNEKFGLLRVQRPGVDPFRLGSVTRIEVDEVTTVREESRPGEHLLMLRRSALRTVVTGPPRQERRASSSRRGTKRIVPSGPHAGPFEESRRSRCEPGRLRGRPA